MKISVHQLKHSRESLTHRMNQAKEGKISELKDKLEDLDKVNKEYGGK